MEHVVNGEISPSDLPRKRRKVTEQHSTPVDHLNKSPLFERRRTRSSLSISEDISVSGRIRPSNRVKKGSSKTLIIDKRSLSEPRRSARQRREVYGTLNETLLLKECAHANRVEEDDQPPSMYDFIKKHKRQQAISPQKNDQEEDDEDSDDSDDDSDDDDEEEDEEGEEEEEEEEENREKAYQLRKERITTKRYMAPPISGKRRRMEAFYVIPHSPMHKRRHHRMAQHASPRHFKKRHYKSSTSSSDNDSDDERRFERRKAKSMARARARCLPMNFDPNDCGGVIKDRERARKRQPIGSSLADVDPMTIDTKVTFESVGGLDKHVKSLKEMVVFPLLYPEVFEKFKIQPPRGVLFYGPPGTGKTLVARALANECGMGGQNVAFFMRKGADCLSKWVGESERQLRLLFDQAYSMRPSIIFFDEIDGLAPVRSTRQDQIHSSIVSTLLALMDGLDARGEIVVIGATNRIDSIDPALRRPGRFDREFLFSLPNREARRKILEIHSKDWQPKLSSAFIGELADKAVGYCGADVKALCTEAALFALRRRFPQIYETKTKLQLNTDEIRVNAKDFQRAMKKIVPASQRSVVSPGRALQLNLKPLLQSTLDAILEIIRSLFPPGKPVQDRQKTNDLSTSTAQSLLLLPDESMSSSDDNDSQSNIYEQGRQRSGRWRRSRRLNSLISSTPPKDFMTLNFRPHSKPVPHRPRFLLAGDEGLGQSTHFAPAVLHSMEHLKVHVLDLPALFGVSSRVPEEACAQIFREARRTAPCIIYLPHIGVWWNSLSETTKATFTTLLEDLPPSTPILLLATSNTSYYELNDRLQKLFSKTTKEVYEVEPPEEEQRKAFFKDLLLTHALLPPPRPKPKRVRRNLEVLPAAAPPPPRELSETELANLRSEEENTLRELRLFLRQITWKLLADRKFKEFSKPVDPEEVEDYLLFIKEPMDLSTIMTRINSHHYQTCKKFLNDIDLITNNCLEYNPDKDVTDRLLRNRACELRDTAYAMVHADLDPEFEKMCEEICESRKKRGDALDVNAPSYIRVLQKNPKTAAKTVKPAATTSNTPAPMTTKMTTTVSNQTTSHDATTSGTQTKRPSALPPPHENSSRCSRRLRGVHAPEFELPYLTKAVEYHLKKEPSKTVKSKSENHKELHSNEEPNEPNSNSKSQNVEETNTAAPSNCDTEKDRVNAQETSPERENSTPYASNDSSLHSINTKTDTIKKDEKPSISNEMPVLADGEYKLETEPMESAESCEEPDIGHITHVHNEVEIILHKDITSTSENCDVGMEEEHEYAKKPEAERVDTTEAKPSTEVSEERPSTSAYSEMTKTTTNTVDTAMVESEPPCISAASPGFKVIERTLVSPSSCSRNLEFDDKNYCNEENRHHEVEKVEVTNEIDNEDSESQEEEMRVTPSSFKSEMERVLIKVVAVTEHYSVTSLERIHSAICNLIYKHRANEDKNMLIKVTGRFPSAWTLWMPPIYVMNAMMPCFKDLHEFIDNLSGDMR